MALILYLAQNLQANLQRARMRTDFRFLRQPAGFTVPGTDFRSVEPIWRAIVVSVRLTLTVSIVGVALAMILGTLVGVMRLSTNWLVRRGASWFVEAFRNVPLAVLLIFLYLAVLQALPHIDNAIEWPGFVFSNRGLHVPWFELAEEAGTFLWALVAGLGFAAAAGWWRTRRFDATGEPHHRFLWGFGAFAAVALPAWALLGRPVTFTVPGKVNRIVDGGYTLTLEHGALLLGLVLYTAAFIAEIVRGAIQAVPKGQNEAATAAGLSSLQRMRYVVLPQAMRVAVPPVGNEFLNLTKNSSLGILIAFPELLRTTRVIIGNGHPAPQLIAIMMGIYLVISLVISLGTNLVNWWLGRRGD